MLNDLLCGRAGAWEMGGHDVGGLADGFLYLQRSFGIVRHVVSPPSAIITVGRGWIDKDSRKEAGKFLKETKRPPVPQWKQAALGAIWDCRNVPQFEVYFRLIVAGNSIL